MVLSLRSGRTTGPHEVPPTNQRRRDVFVSGFFTPFPLTRKRHFHFIDLATFDVVGVFYAYVNNMLTTAYWAAVAWTPRKCSSLGLVSS